MKHSVILPVKWNASVLGNFFALWRLNWAGDSLGYWDEIFIKRYKTYPQSSIDHSTLYSESNMLPLDQGSPCITLLKYITFRGMQANLIGG